MGPALLSAINQVYADEDDDADNLSSDALTGERSRQLEFQIKLDETMRQFWTNEEEITRVCMKWPHTIVTSVLNPNPPRAVQLAEQDIDFTPFDLPRRVR